MCRYQFGRFSFNQVFIERKNEEKGEKYEDNV